MLGTGCRIGEAVAVQDDAIGRGAREVAIVADIVRVTKVGLVRHEGKTSAARRVLPLPGFLIDTLAEAASRTSSPARWCSVGQVGLEPTT